MECVEDTVKKLIARFLNDKPKGDFPLDAKLEEDLGMDSLGFVEMIMVLEDTYHVSISSEDGKRLVKVGDVVECVAKASVSG